VVLVVESDCSADLLDVHIECLLGEEVKAFLGLGSSVLLDISQGQIGIPVVPINIDVHLAATSYEQQIVLFVEIDVGNTKACP